MDDDAIHDRINRLADEEESLFERASEGGGLEPQQTARLHDIEVELDRSYDLLAQRRAKRAAGQNPDDAELRPPDTVERYQQ